MMQKNDLLDAEAIGEAVQRPTTRFVPLKTMEQLDLQAIHRLRTRLVARRTAVLNQMRGFLLERGVAVPIGRCALGERFPDLVHDPTLGLSVRFCRLLQQLRDEWRLLDDDIEEVDQEIRSLARNDEACERLMEVPGIGPLTAAALVAAVGNGAAFAKRRDLAAWLGLVPRRHSTGGKTTLRVSSKRGNAYLLACWPERPTRLSQPGRRMRRSSASVVMILFSLAAVAMRLAKCVNQCSGGRT